MNSRPAAVCMSTPSSKLTIATSRLSSSARTPRRWERLLPQPIELDYGYSVHPTTTGSLQQSLQTFPLIATPRLPVIEELVGLPAPSFCVLSKSVELRIEGLLGGGDSGVEGHTEG